MTSTFIMDTIVTNAKTYVGVIDLVTTKHVMFYDFTQNNNPDIVTMAIIWKSYYGNLRFSVFKSLYFDHYDIGHPIMINKKTIQNDISHISQSKPKKKVIRTITNESRRG